MNVVSTILDPIGILLPDTGERYLSTWLFSE